VFSYTPPPTPPPPPRASVVIGEPNFNSSSQGTGQAQIGYAEYLAVDNSGNLWVSDYQNGRVDEFTPPFSNGESSALEIGAANFSFGGCATGNALCEPSGIAIDPSGNLWAGDGQNASVQEFKAPFSLGKGSSVLLGGYYLDHPPNATNFGPNGLASDSSGDLWVVDGGFNRVLEFTPPFTSREAASLVIGQPNFTTRSNTNNQSMLSGPYAVTFDHSGNLWVADTGDNRVLEFKAPFSSGESASVAIGQPTLLSTSANTTQSTLAGPEGLAFDTHGNLWVSDTGNSRIMEFVPPFSTGMNATVVIGQESYFFSGLGTDQSSLNYPEGLAAGANGNIWVADTENYRVLLFVDPASAATVTTSTSTTLTPTAIITSTAASQTASSSQAQTSALSSVSTSSATSAGIPEFPYQLAAAGIFTLVLAGVYVLIRRRNLL
jgi:sugar lactone lactonase YvrE